MNRMLKAVALMAAVIAWAGGTYACTLAAYRSASDLMRVPSAVGVVAAAFGVGAFLVGMLASFEGGD